MYLFSTYNHGGSSLFNKLFTTHTVGGAPAVWIHKTRPLTFGEPLSELLTKDGTRTLGGIRQAWGDFIELMESKDGSNTGLGRFKQI